MNVARLAPLAAVVGVVGCSPVYTAVEPVASSSVRVFVVFDGDEAQTFVRTGSDRLSYDLASAFSEGRSVDVWMLVYQAETLAKNYPSLEGLNARQVADALDPRLIQGAEGWAPDADQVLSLRLVEGAGEASSYTARAWSEWKEASVTERGVSLNLASLPSNMRRPCEAIELERLDGPADSSYRFVVALSSSVAYTTGPSTQTSTTMFRTDPIHLGRIDGGRLTELPDDPRRVGLSTSLAYDGSSLWVMNFARGRARERLFRIGLDGRALDNVWLPSERTRRVTATPNGALFFYGLSGLYTVVDGSTVATKRDDFEGAPQFGHAARKDRIVMSDDEEILAFDGVEWSTYKFSRATEVSRAGADDVTFAVVGGLELVVAHDGERWRTLPRPYDLGISLRGIAPAGDGDLVVAGRSGTIAAWMDGRWCTLDTGTSVNLNDASAHAPSKVVFVVGDDHPALNSPPALYRVTLPRPR